MDIALSDSVFSMAWLCRTSRTSGSIAALGFAHNAAWCTTGQSATTQSGDTAVAPPRKSQPRTNPSTWPGTGASWPGSSPLNARRAFHRIAAVSRRNIPKRDVILRFHFVGTSYVAPGQGVPSVLTGSGGNAAAATSSRRFPTASSCPDLRIQQRADALPRRSGFDAISLYSPSKAYLHQHYRRNAHPGPGFSRQRHGAFCSTMPCRCAFMVRFSSIHAQRRCLCRTRSVFRPRARVCSRGLPAGAERYPSMPDISPDELTRQQCALFDATLTSR